jgi:orotidine-5'-phosphate decarboxylase
MDAQKGGFIINSSRGIIYASKGKDFAEAARKAALALRDGINAFIK